MNTMLYKNCLPRIGCDERDNLFEGRVLGLCSISFHADTVPALRHECEVAMED